MNIYIDRLTKKAAPKQIGTAFRVLGGYSV